jgi:hypothetical protein
VECARSCQARQVHHPTQQHHRIGTRLRHAAWRGGLLARHDVEAGCGGMLDFTDDSKAVLEPDAVIDAHQQHIGRTLLRENRKVSTAL